MFRHIYVHMQTFSLNLFHFPLYIIKKNASLSEVKKLIDASLTSNEMDSYSS